MAYYDAMILSSLTDMVGCLMNTASGKLSPVVGLKLEPDTYPYTSGAMIPDTDVIDGNKYTGVTTNYWANSYSYGIDLGSEHSVEKLSVYCNPGPVTPESWYTASHDSLAVYKSTDGTTWTLVQQFDGPTMTHKELRELSFDLVFDIAQIARYFKVVYVDFATLAVNPGGASCKLGEIEAYGIKNYGKVAIKIDNTSTIRMAENFQDPGLDSIHLALQIPNSAPIHMATTNFDRGTDGTNIWSMRIRGV